ncbi:FmdB family transcriptional regulator [Betaproteobacteria bacterium SCGC AG-212-J23]|nr:FmdB family transcriptional regulator [Betaproteobacteria bacterium SCGC AG-212-J23]
MPIYEYRCAECGHQEEHLQKLSERPLSKCPACGKKAYKKQLSAAGFQLKGSGWYATDFKSAGKKPAEKKADLKSDGKTEAKSEAKTETKTETKTPAKKASAAATTD